MEGKNKRIERKQGEKADFLSKKFSQDNGKGDS
jgi:hypothetical protein